MDAVRSRREELQRLRRVARTALERFGIPSAALTILRHEHNTTYRVDTPAQRYVLRINRRGVHGSDTIESEMAWLLAIARDTTLHVPELVRASEGRAVVTLTDAPGAAPLHVVVMRWQHGRFVHDRLTPWHLRQVAILECGLHDHASAWRPPPWFVRPRVDTLTSNAKAHSISAGARGGVHPTVDDAEEAVTLVAGLMSRWDADRVRRSLDVVWDAVRSLDAVPGSSGLVHGDLHDDNVLYRDGIAVGIDFDDCGWGFLLYDLAVTLWELQDRPRYPALRDALLDEYAQRRPLPAAHDSVLAALVLLRRLQILVWILESRDHVAFRARWRSWAAEETAAIAAALSSIDPR